MDRAELRALWERNNDRPAFVREYREELHEHINTADPIPEGSMWEVSQWLDRYKGTVTRQLNDDSDGTDPHDAEDTNTDAPEKGSE